MDVLAWTLPIIMIAQLLTMFMLFPIVFKLSRALEYAIKRWYFAEKEIQRLNETLAVPKMSKWEKN